MPGKEKMVKKSKERREALITIAITLLSATAGFLIGQMIIAH